MMKSTLHDLVGDLIVFRNLSPADRRLPRLAEAWRLAGLASATPPRKHELSYARVTTWYLRRAQELDNPGYELQELVYLGDTAMSDGGAFRNLRSAGGWRGWAFIGVEKDESLVISEQDGIYSANRWSALADFARSLRYEQGAYLDERTALVIDVDKTALGARGRNDSAIDRARTLAIEATIADAIGPSFDVVAFRTAYAALNRTRYHAFTADNQDYLAYVCLMISSGFTSLAEVQAGVDSGRLQHFQQFIAEVEAHRSRLPTEGVVALHADCYARVLADDPTPFKAFRRREYRETVERMGHLPDDVPLARRLVEEICLTREVMEFARWLRWRGCLLMALSDKPDEATEPSAELAAQGYLPLHRVATHVLGRSIADLLTD